jgi:hypothetical protein
MPNLSELLAAAKGTPISFNGKTIRGIFQRDTKNLSSVTIHFVKFAPTPLQGLRLKHSKGNLEVNGQLVREVILWTDTAPQTVVVGLPTKEGTFKAWNAWRDERGTTQAWMGNAGMEIIERPDGVRLYCSDGEGPPNFEDLVVDLSFT